MKRFRIAIGRGFIEPSHRLASYESYKEATKAFELVANHPRRKHYAELYFIQPDGQPESVAWTIDP